jgi:hypothetical protein
MLNKEKIKNALDAFRKLKVFTLDQVVSSLNCSMPSARLKVRQWKTYTSYNQNGRYYVLPTVPCFDDNGLWRYKGIYFSKNGNLKNTVVHLINKSSSGLTGKQISDIVWLSARSFLHHFRDAQGICRDKHDGVYVYFSDNPDTYKHQTQNRLAGIPVARRRIAEADAVAILVGLIKHHDISIEDIMALPEIKAKNLSALVIREFLEHHGLLKKIPHTKR